MGEGDPGRGAESPHAALGRREGLRPVSRRSQTFAGGDGHGGGLGGRRRSEGNPVYLPAASHASEAALEEGGRGIAIRQSTVLSEAMTLRGIRPLGVVEVSAILPDRRVEHLIWIPVFHGEWNRTYYLRTPLRLPKGTKIVVSGAGVQLE